MSPEEINDQLLTENANLAELGVRPLISRFTGGAHQWGWQYEHRVNPEEGIRPTPINCLMALLFDQPSLGELPDEEFKRIAGTISRISMLCESLGKKPVFM